MCLRPVNGLELFKGSEGARTVKKTSESRGHRSRLQPQLLVLQRHRPTAAQTHEPSPWWRSKQFLVPTAISVVLAVAGFALTVPSLLPKISIAYDGTGQNQNVATFIVSNDGTIGLNDVSAKCNFTKLVYSNPNWKVENNQMVFEKKIENIPRGGTALIICPLPVSFGQAPISGLLEISLNYRPDFGS
jgi:hypothetical protein